MTSRTRAIVVAVLAVGVAVLFRDVVAKLVHDWAADENYSHGFLVVPLAGYVVWRHRDRLAALPIRPSATGLMLIIVSVLVLLAGTVGVELLLPRIALLGTLAGVILFVWGRQHLRVVSFAFLLFALAIPIPAIIFNQITVPLQLLASRFGESVISACRIPVLREGNVIVLATTSLEVAEACSGIRSLVSLLSLAIIGGYFTNSPMWIRWLLAISSVPIAIFANGIRVSGTAIAAQFLGPAAAEGFFHVFSGWIVFLVAGVLLLIVYRLATWLGPGGRREEPLPAPQAAPPPLSPAQEKGLVTRSLVVAACLAVAAIALSGATRTEAVVLHKPLGTIPLTLGAWTGRDNPPFDADVMAVLRVDEYLNRNYAAPGRPWVGLYVGYYQTQRQGQTVHSPLNCMPGSGWEPVERGRIALPAQAGGAAEAGRVEINKLVVQRGLDRYLVLYWYQAHGRIVASEYWGRIYTVLDAIRLNRSDASLVRVMVPMSSQDGAGDETAERAGLAFVDALLPVLSGYLDR